MGAPGEHGQGFILLHEVCVGLYYLCQQLPRALVWSMDQFFCVHKEWCRSEGTSSSAHAWQRTHRWSHCCDRAEDVAQYYKFQWVYEGYHWLRSLVGTDLQHRLDLPFYSRKQYQGNIKAHQQLDALVLAEQWRLSAKHYWLLVVFYPQK